MIDLKRYDRLYPEGLCHVEKSTEKAEFVALFKRFDNETGKELTPEPHFFNPELIEIAKADLLSQLSAIKIIEGEIANLK